MKDANGNPLYDRGWSGGASSASFGFSDSRQTNFATICAGTIIIRDGDSAGTAAGLEGLNRDVSKAQYGTMNLGVQLSVDKQTINAIMNPLDTYQDAVEGLNQIAERGRKIEQQTHIVERTGNLIEYKHFTTDDKVQYCLNMDDYEEKKANGESVDALDTLVYLKSKSAAGYELDRSDMSGLRLASGYVIDDATNGIRENLEANIRVNTREDVNASLAVLDRFDKEDAILARGYLAGVREAEKRTSVIIADGVSSVAANDGLVYEKSSEKNGGVREMLEGWGQSLNSWGTGKNKAISDSSIVRDAHQYGESLGNDPGKGMEACIKSAAFGFTLPYAVTEMVAVSITKTVAEKSIIGATNTAVTYALDRNASKEELFMAFVDPFIPGPSLSKENVINVVGKDGVASNRGNGGRGGGVEHANVQNYISDIAGGRQERQIDLGDTGKYRIVDNIDANGRIHQIGDMRSRGGYNPSSRERGAIEDIRKEVGPDVDIIYHDKRGKGPSLINPDLQPDWKPASEKYRKW